MSIHLDEEKGLTITRENVRDGENYVNMMRALLSVSMMAREGEVNDDDRAQVLGLIKDCIPNIDQADKMFELNKTESFE